MNPHSQLACILRIYLASIARIYIRQSRVILTPRSPLLMESLRGLNGIDIAIGVILDKKSQNLGQNALILFVAA